MNHRIHIDAEAVTDATNLQVLVERVFAAIFRKDSDITFAVGNLIVAGGIISNVRVRQIFDVSDNTLKDFCDRDVGFIVRRDDFAGRSVLSLFICYEPDMLWQLVNRQAWTCVDRLALHRASGRQHVGRPLPCVIWTASHKAQVI